MLAQDMHMSQSKEPEVARCLWEQAGVVRRKRCTLDYACQACTYDRALRKAAAKNKERRAKGKALRGKAARIEHWKDRLRRLPPLKRPCIHSMKQEISFRPCSNDYLCFECDFHQYFQDQFTVYTAVKPVDLLNVHGFSLPHGFYLHDGHTWVKLEENNTVRIGMDDFVHRLLGPLDAIRAPLVGKRVRRGEPAVTLQRGELRAEVSSPVSGVVTEINPLLREDGGLARKQPYDEGWIMRVHAPNLTSDLRKLRLSQESADFLHQELHRLEEAVEEAAGPLAADGGELGDDIYGNLPSLGWDRLCRMFL